MAAWSKLRQAAPGERLALYLVPWSRGRGAEQRRESSHALAKIMILVLGVACWCGQANGADEQATPASRRYHSLPGSKVTIEGYSNIHDWRAEGSLIAGYLEVGLGFPQSAPRGTQIKARAELFIPVKNLKAVGSDGEQITAVMHRTLRAQEHPKIIFRLLGLTASASEPSTDTRRKFDSTGELVIGGVTNKVSMPVIVEVVSGGALKISVKAEVRQSDFNLRPRPRMESWVDNDTVKIQCEWRVAEKGEPK